MKNLYTKKAQAALAKIKRAIPPAPLPFPGGVVFEKERPLGIRADPFVALRLAKAAFESLTVRNEQCRDAYEAVCTALAAEGE